MLPDETFIMNPIAPLPPGGCDRFGCEEPGRYQHAAFGTYWCSRHLIEELSTGRLKKGAVFFRVPVYDLETIC